MLRYVAGLLHQPPTRRVSDELSKEVVDLLNESGVRSREQWLDLVGEMKDATPIINRVIHYFPTGHYPLRITDSHMGSYTVLLRDLPSSRVEIYLDWDLTGKEAELGALINTLGKHMCTQLELNHHYRHPDPSINSDHFLPDMR